MKKIYTSKRQLKPLIVFFFFFLQREIDDAIDVAASLSLLRQSDCLRVHASVAMHIVKTIARDRKTFGDTDAAKILSIVYQIII